MFKGLIILVCEVAVTPQKMERVLYCLEIKKRQEVIPVLFYVIYMPFKEGVYLSPTPLIVHRCGFFLSSSTCFFAGIDEL